MRSQPTPAATGLASILPDQPAGSLALAAAVAASAHAAPASTEDRLAASPDATLLALGAEMDRAEAALVDMRAAVFLDIEEKDADAWRAYRAADEAQEAFIAHRIAPLRAVTSVGAAVKARALAHLHHPESFLRDHLEGTTAGAILASLATDFAPAAPPTPYPDAALLQLAADYFAAAAQRRTIYAASDDSFRRQNAIDEGAAVPDNERAEVEAGITLFHERADAVEGAMDKLLRAMAVTPAVTMDGLRGKAQAAIDDMTDKRARWLADEHIPALLAKNAQAVDIHPARNLAVVFSVLLDAARLATFAQEAGR